MRKPDAISDETWAALDTDQRTFLSNHFTAHDMFYDHMRSGRSLTLDQIDNLIDDLIGKVN
jgi:hypothetical protein